MAETVVSELRFELNKLRQDARKATDIAKGLGKDISSAINDAGKSASDAKNSLKDVGDGLKQVSNESRINRNATLGMASAWTDLKTVLVGLGLVKLAKEIVDLSAAMIKNAESITSFRTQINILTGDMKKTNELYAFVKETSDKLAISTLDSTKAFASLSNSAKGTVLAGQGVKLIFESLLTAGSALRADQDRMRRVFLQVNQAISRQKFETEDLNTIAETGIPVYRILQEAIGKTGEELRDMIRDGKVGLKEMIDFAIELDKEYSGIAKDMANTVPARFTRVFNRIKISVEEFYEELLRTKEIKEITDAFERLFNTISAFSTNPAIKEASKAAGGFWSETARSTIDGIAFLFQVINERSAQIFQWMQKTFGGGADTSGLDKIEKKFESFQKSFREFFLGRREFRFGFDTPRGSEAFSENLRKEEDEKVNAALKEKIRIEKERKLNLDYLKDKKHAEETLEELRFEYHKDELERIRKESQAEADAWHDTRNRINRERESQDKKDLRELQKKAREIARRVRRELEDELDLDEAVNELILDELSFNEQQRKDFAALFIPIREDIADSLQGVLVDVFKGEQDGVMSVLKTMKDGVVAIAEEMSRQFIIEPLMKRAEGFLIGDFLESGVLGGVVGDVAKRFDAAAENIDFKGIGKGALGGVAGAQVGLAISNLAQVNKEQTAIIAGLSGAASGAIAGSAAGPYGIIAGAIVGAAAGVIPAMLGGNNSTSADVNLLSGRLASDPRNQLKIGPQGKPLFATTTLGDIGITEDRSKRSDALLQIIADFDKSVTNALSESLVKKISDAWELRGNQIAAEAESFEELQADVLQRRMFEIVQRTLAIPGTAEQGGFFAGGIAEKVVGQLGSGTPQNIQAISRQFNDALSIIQAIHDISLNIDTQAGERIKSINDQFGNLIRNAESLGLPVDILNKEMQRLLDEIPDELNKAAKLELLLIKDNAEGRREELRRQHEEERKEFEAAGADMSLLKELQAARFADLEKQLSSLSDTAETASQSIQELDAALSRAQAFQDQGFLGIVQNVKTLKESFRDIFNELKDSGARPSDLQDLRKSFVDQLSELYRSARIDLILETENLINTFNAALISIDQRAIELQKLVENNIIKQPDVDNFLKLSRALANMSESTRLLQGGQSEVEQLGSAIESFFAFGSEISPVVSEIQSLVDTFSQLRAASLQAGIRVSGFQKQFEKSIDILTQKELDRIDDLLAPRRERLNLIDDFIKGQALGEERPLSNRLSTLENRFFDSIRSADVESSVQLASELRELSKQQFGSTAGFFQLEDRINTALMGLRAEEVAAINDERQIMIDQFNTQVQMVSRMDSSLQLLEDLLNQGYANSKHTQLLIDLARQQNSLTNSVQGTLETLLREVIT